MNDRQRDLFADKVVDLGHVVFGSLVIGQFVEGLAWKWSLFTIGVGFQLLMYWLAYRLTRRQA